MSQCRVNNIISNINYDFLCVCVCVSKIEDTAMNAQSGPHCVSMFAQENTKSSAKSFPVLTFQISTASVNPFAS